LRHAAERAVILAPGDQYQVEDFPLGRTAATPVSIPPSAPIPAELNLERVERETVEAALRKHSYNISHAAAELGLSRFALYRRMEKHGL
jgi:transcriptional regulator of acetoin/glycerol metabolism